MRLREPFNGIKHGQGHFFFHFALLAGSLIAVKLPNEGMGTMNFITDPHRNGLPGLQQLV